jgi:hypothetical protein
MRGQAVVEWMVLLSVAMLVLAVILSLNEENYAFFRNNVKVSQVKSALNGLKNAVDFVYSQGTEAKTRIYVTVPSGSNFTIRTLEGGGGQIEAVVYVKGGEQPYDVYTDANLSGVLPSVSGSYCMDVEYVGPQVNITRSDGSC